MALSNASKITKKKGPLTKSVFDLNLVRPDELQENQTTPLQAIDILDHCDGYDKAAKKVFNRKVLGTLPPWTSYKKNLIPLFKNKFNYISYGRIEINVRHELIGADYINEDWKVKSYGMLPTMVIKNWKATEYIELFNKPSKVTKIAEKIVALCRKHKFSGVVFEMWEHLKGEVRDEFANIVINLSKVVRMSNLLFIMAIPPPVYEKEHTGYFEKLDFDKIVKNIDYFALQTHNFSTPYRPGPISPIHWIQTCVETLDPVGDLRYKILLGIGFSGIAISADGGHYLNSTEYKQHLKSIPGNTLLKWDPASAEYSFDTKIEDIKHTIYYPTLKSIQLRLKLAEKLKTGVWVMNMGEGLDYFFDLF